MNKLKHISFKVYTESSFCCQAFTNCMHGYGHECNMHANSVTHA